jgi:cysteine desulfuration protein SufE
MIQTDLLPTSVPLALGQIIQKFQHISEPKRRYEYLLWFAKQLPPFPSDQKLSAHKVLGCASQVYITASLENSRVIFQGDSDSQITKGLVGLLIGGLNGSTPVEIMQLAPNFIQQTGLDISLTPSRVNGFYNIFQALKQRTLDCYLFDGSLAS